jgi:hypothetical protein
MATEAALDLSTPGLSEPARLVDTFLAPSKTFADIRRNAAWWAPFVLMVLSSLASAFVVDRQVGFDRVYQNTMASMPMVQDQISKLPPEQQAATAKSGAARSKYTAYAFPIILLIILTIYSLILWAIFNFALGAQTTFAQVLAVSWYGALPYLITVILTIVTLYFGGNSEAYDSRNPVGTNLAYYLTDAPGWLKGALQSVDLIKIWSDVLQVIGMAIIARKTLVQSALVVGGLWFIGLLLGAAGGAFTG